MRKAGLPNLYLSKEPLSLPQYERLLNALTKSQALGEQSLMAVTTTLNRIYWEPFGELHEDLANPPAHVLAPTLLR